MSDDYEAMLSAMVPNRKRKAAHASFAELTKHMKDSDEESASEEEKKAPTKTATKVAKKSATKKSAATKVAKVPVPRLSKDDKRTLHHKPTEEQQAFIESKLPVKGGYLIKVESYAASGKSSSIKNYIAKRPDKQFTYVVFNRNMSLEATKKFKSLPNVKVKTYHGLGFEHNITKGGYKLFLPAGDSGRGYRFYNQLIQKHMKDSGLHEYFADRFKLKDKSAWDEESNPWNYRALWNYTMWALDKFCLSGETEVMEKHCTKLLELIKKKDDLDSIESSKVRYRIKSSYAPHVHDVLALANYIVKAIVTKDIKTINQNFSIKLLHLNNPKLEGDGFVMDECQDAMPVMREVIKQQKHMAWILVGDSLQAINAWMNATNIMNKLDALIPKECIEEHTLSESFRWGPSVAALCNKLFAKVRYKLKKPFRSNLSPDTLIKEIPDDPTEVAKFVMAKLPELAEESDKAAIKTKAKGKLPALDLAVISRTKMDLLVFMNSWIDEIARLDLDLQHFEFKCSTAIKSSLDAMIKIGKLSNSEMQVEMDKKVKTFIALLVMEPNDEDLKGKIKMLKFLNTREDRRLYVHKLDILLHPRKNKGKKVEDLMAAAGADAESEAESEEMKLVSSADEEENDAEAAFMARVSKPVTVRRKSLEGFYSSASSSEEDKPARLKPKPVVVVNVAKVEEKKTEAPKAFTGRKVKITAISGHASKGLEFDHTFILGIKNEMDTLIQRAKQVVREAANGGKREAKVIVYQHALYLIYVMFTRCRKSLYVPKMAYDFIQ